MKVNAIVLSDNGLTDAVVNLLLQIIFSLPYLKRLDLRKNAFTPDAIKKFQQQCQNIQGVTSVIWTKEQSLAVHSGNQLRLTVTDALRRHHGDQLPPLSELLGSNPG